MTPVGSPRWTTAADRQSLARRLGLPYAPAMQDWEWEVADPARFGELLAASTAADLTDGERVSLAEMLIQCVEDMRMSAVGTTPEWKAVAAVLLTRPDLHAGTVEYWSSPDATTPDEGFWVAEPMRHVREAMRGVGRQFNP